MVSFKGQRKREENRFHILLHTSVLGVFHFCYLWDRIWLCPHHLFQVPFCSYFMFFPLCNAWIIMKILSTVYCFMFCNIYTPYNKYLSSPVIQSTSFVWWTHNKFDVLFTNYDLIHNVRSSLFSLEPYITNFFDPCIFISEDKIVNEYLMTKWHYLTNFFMYSCQKT